MKLVVRIKLLPDVGQAELLLAYMKIFNAAASHAARVGFEAKVFSQPSIHARCYRELRETYSVSAQTAVRAIGKTVECFAQNKNQQPVFKSLGAVTYDQRNLSFKGIDRVSMTVATGRILVPYVVGEYFKGSLHALKGQVDLVYRDGKFFLHCAVDTPEPPTESVSEFLGVDVGIVNVATDSTGEQFTGEQVEKIRKRSATARKTFQRRGTKSAKRRLKKLSGRQSRFQKQENHRISKRIVAKAKALGLGIAVEDLRGIRSRTEKTVRRKQRSKLSNWSFFQLRTFLTYKAKLAGIPIVAVDPRNTSRTCSVCGHCEEANRKSQDQFLCLSCGHSDHADHNAAMNIAARGAVNHPHKRPDR